MHHTARLFMLIAAFLAAGCGSEVGGDHGGKGGSSETSIAPKGAQWTIMCAVINTSDHVTIAKSMKEAMSAGTTLRNWWVMHSDGGSVVNCGYYQDVKDADAQRDLGIIRALRDSNGMLVFPQARLQPMESANPSGPPEWDLANAAGYYSLAILGFKDRPERKEAAVQAVKDLREHGVPAYYFHGPTTSMVCVGTWAKEAVAMADDGEGVVATNPGSDMVVLNKHATDAQLDQVRQTMGEGTDVRAPQTKVVDPTLAGMMRKYPEYALNYEVKMRRQVDRTTGAVKLKPSESFVVRIPEKPSVPGLISPGPSGLYNPGLPPTGGTGQLPTGNDRVRIPGE